MRVIACAIAVALMLPGRIPASAAASQDLVVANETDVTLFDPIRMQEAPTSFVAGFVYEQLVQRASDGKVAPALAESWKLSPDRRTWTFSLRKGVKFHDGSEFDASVVEWAFKRVLDPQEPSLFRGQFSVIQKIAVVDKYTIAFTVKEPNVAFLDYVMLTNGAYIPSKRAFETLGKDFPYKPVGTGPFRWGQWVQGQRVVLERNPSYWGTPAKLDRIVIRPIADPNTGVIELETGGVHYIMRANRDDLTRLGKDKRFVVYRAPTYRVRYVSLNDRHAPFDDARVRQAAAYALDVPQIVNTLAAGMAVPADTILPLESPFHPARGSYPTYATNPARARELLGQAGWATGPGGTLQKSGQPLRIVLHSPDGRYFMDKEMSEAICNRLHAVGFDCRVRVMEWAAFLEETRAGKFDASFSGWNQSSGEPSLFLDALVATGGRANYGRHTDPAIDAVLQEGLGAFSDGRRKLLYAKAIALVNQHAWYIPIDNEFKIAVATARLQGYVHTPARTELSHAWLK
jgi:peptide/nickel transport system substrate-binding protein